MLSFFFQINKLMCVYFKRWVILFFLLPATSCSSSDSALENSVELRVSNLGYSSYQKNINEVPTYYSALVQEEGKEEPPVLVRYEFGTFKYNNDPKLLTIDNDFVKKPVHIYKKDFSFKVNETGSYLLDFKVRDISCSFSIPLIWEKSACYYSLLMNLKTKESDFFTHETERMILSSGIDSVTIKGNFDDKISKHQFFLISEIDIVKINFWENL